MANLTFYTNPQSRGRIARWMLEEVGEPYETVFLGYADSMKSAQYLAVNPMGKVPTVRHGDVVVTETAAICAYLADAFPESDLAPPLDQRGAYYRWLFFGAGPIEMVMTHKGLGVETKEEQARMVGYGSVEVALETLAGALARSPYLTGDKFTAADVYVGAQVMWGLQFELFPKRPEFTGYMERVCSRDAFSRAMALDDAAAKEAVSFVSSPTVKILDAST
ncbi:MAG: glutathione S-transferase family protein, partial [Pseudomonadota bacterium]